MQAKKGIVTKAPDLRIPAFRTVRNVCCLSHPANGIVLQGSGLTETPQDVGVVVPLHRQEPALRGIAGHTKPCQGLGQRPVWSPSPVYQLEVLWAGLNKTQSSPINNQVSQNKMLGGGSSQGWGMWLRGADRNPAPSPFLSTILKLLVFCSRDTGHSFRSTVRTGSLGRVLETHDVFPLRKKKPFPKTSASPYLATPEKGTQVACL